jgi:hypothetical protein
MSGVFCGVIACLSYRVSLDVTSRRRFRFGRRMRYTA